MSVVKVWTLDSMVIVNINVKCFILESKLPLALYSIHKLDYKKHSFGSKISNSRANKETLTVSLNITLLTSTMCFGSCPNLLRKSHHHHGFRVLVRVKEVTLMRNDFDVIL